MNYQNSVALFVKKEPSTNANKYIGKLKTFDALVTKKNNEIASQINTHPPMNIPSFIMSRGNVTL